MTTREEYIDALERLRAAAETWEFMRMSVLVNRASQKEFDDATVEKAEAMNALVAMWPVPQ